MFAIAGLAGAFEPFSFLFKLMTTRSSRVNRTSFPRGILLRRLSFVIINIDDDSAKESGLNAAMNDEA